MTEDKKAELKEKYRFLLLPFGYDCDNKWLEAIEKLCQQIQEILNKNMDLKFNVVQIVNKFGGLRIYTSHSQIENMEVIKQLHELINNFENDSLSAFDEE